MSQKAMGCLHHPEREARVRCQKMEIGYCLECLEQCMECTDPWGYCKFRTQCIIWEQWRHSEKRCRLHEAAQQGGGS